MFHWVAIRWCVDGLGMDARLVDALPTAMAKPFFGSAGRTILIKKHAKPRRGQICRAGRSHHIRCSTETTFYVLAVYFGAVGIQKARHALPCALVAELAGVVAAIGVTYWFFG